MTTIELRQNAPNPSVLIESLRSSGYSPVTALLDLLDNCFDAHATSIYLDFNPKTNEIIIVDNGKGMGWKTLDEALKLGSLRERSSTELGKFGMGLITASISMARKVSVLTRTQNGEVLYSSQDLDTIIETNSFVKELGFASEEQRALYNQYLSNERQGTLVVLSKLDRLDVSSIPKLFSSLSNEAARIYRVALTTTTTLRIKDPNKNGFNQVEAYDPLYLKEGGFLVYDRNDRYKVLGKEIQLKIRVAVLPQRADYPLNRRPSYESQGFYILRNQREIVAASPLGLLPRHNENNYIRAEIYYEGGADEFFNVDFKKQTLRINSYLAAQLEKQIKPALDQARSLSETNPASKERKLKKDKIIQELLAAAYSVRVDLIAPGLSRDAKGTLKPKLKLTTSEAPDPVDPSPSPNPNPNPKPASDLKSKLDSIRKTHFPEISIELNQLNERDPFFRFDLEEKSLTLTINTAHTFYRLSESTTDGSQVLILLALCQSLASLNQLQEQETSELNQQLEQLNFLTSSNLGIISKALLA